MIEGPAGPHAQPPRRSRNPLAGWRETVSGLFERIRRAAMPAPALGTQSDVLLVRLHLVERIIWVLLIGLGLYLLTDLVMLRRQLPAFPVPGVTEPGGVAQVTVSERLRPLVEYRDAILSRNPFHQRAGRAAPKKESDSQLQQMTASLTVVGINRGRIPEALIEDTVAKRTYFVRVGDELNELTVTAITTQGVSVKYGDEETILR